MAFPASQLRLSQVLDQIAGTMSNTRSYALSRRAEMLAGNVGADRIIDVWEHLKATKARLQSLGATPGIAAYAQAQYDDDTLDLAAEFTAVIAAVNGVTANVESTFPADGSGWLLAAKFGAGGTLEYRQFTPAQLATLAGLLNDLAATIS